MLYVVINTNNRIEGRFTNKERAINFMIEKDLLGYNKILRLIEMTEEEYEELVLSIIKGEI